MSRCTATAHLTTGMVLLGMLLALAACHPAGPDLANGQSGQLAEVDASVAQSQQAGHTTPPRADTFAAFLVPLTTDDVHFYLMVMHAAAARKLHPTASDTSVLQTERTHAAAEEADNRYNAPIIAAHEAKVQAAMAAIHAARARGDVAAVRAAMAQASQAPAIKTVPDLDPAVARHAELLETGAWDTLIVEERHLDANRYQRVKDDIEEIYSPIPGVDTSCRGGCGNVQRTPAQIRDEKLLEAAEARNRKTLAPYAAQIRAVQASVEPFNSTSPPP